MTTKEFKTKIMDELKRYVESTQRMIEKDANKFDETFDKAQLAAYQEIMSIVEDVPIEGSVGLNLIEGQRYKCLENLHWSCGEGVMFTKGNVYVVI